MDTLVYTLNNQVFFSIAQLATRGTSSVHPHGYPPAGFPIDFQGQRPFARLGSSYDTNTNFMHYYPPWNKQFAPETRPSQKETRIPTIHFQVMLVSGRVT